DQAARGSPESGRHRTLLGPKGGDPEPGLRGDPSVGELPREAEAFAELGARLLDVAEKQLGPAEVAHGDHTLQRVAWRPAREQLAVGLARSCVVLGEQLVPAECVE